MYCIYCGKNKPATQKSGEHILPQSMGGNLQPTNPLKTDRVCITCNSNSGVFIDGEFTRSWFFQNARASNARDYTDISAKTTLPLTYIGYLNSNVIEGYDCEVWTGPAGDSIFHFHRPYPVLPRKTGHVGPPITSRIDIDPGFVIIFIVATNPVWHPVIIRSVLARFTPATFYLGNGPKPEVEGFKTIPAELEPALSELKNLMMAQLPIKTKHYIHWGIRFLAKLALGFGCLFLAEGFAKSKESKLLRRALWEFDEKRFEELKLFGTGFLSGSPKEFGDAIKWPAGHVLSLLPTSEGLAFAASFYGELSGTLLVTKNERYWTGRIDPEGHFYVIDPSRRDFVGPITLLQYGEARSGIQTKPIDVRPFINRGYNKVVQPPFHLQ